MRKTFIIPVAMLAILGTSGVVFAGQASDDHGQRHVRHHHDTVHHRTDEPEHSRLPWILPQGWPQG